MKILFCTVPFYPSVGGTEAVAALLARQFVAAGHEVTLVTQTPFDGAELQPFPVLRRPEAADLCAAVQRADVVFHNNVSLRLGWPLLLHRRPWVVAHHTWLPRRGRGAWAGWAKRGALRAARQVAVSTAVARDVGPLCSVIPNPYDDSLFRRLDGLPRDRDIVCVARLVSDKGVDLLLRALALLHRAGPARRLTVVGSGPEELALRALAAQLGVAGQVHFAGRLQGQALVEVLNRHRVAVVPSVWEEPFGLVALEALACGCLPVVAASGGLPEAAGPTGVVFPKGNDAALAACLQRPLEGPAAAADPRVAAHLERHRPPAVAALYLKVIEDHVGRTAQHAIRAA